jgi:RNA-splicing ligase RtcB
MIMGPSCRLFITMLRPCGSLGTGNHFIEVCLDEGGSVWVMLHSGSRGVGNRIGRYFIELAKKDMERHCISLPDKDLAYLEEGVLDSAMLKSLHEIYGLRL